MKKIRVAIVGYGNIGKYALQAALTAPDFEVAGIVRRNPEQKESSIPVGIKVTGKIEDLENVDVAILACPSRKVEAYAQEMLKKGVNTVDSFDIHTEIPALRRSLAAAANAAGKVAVISAGWDPGSDSVVRALMTMMAPKGVTYTNFGPGMSMGHTVAVKAISGVRNALSMTIPLGTGIHRRMVYVEIEDGYDIDKVAAAIKADPYFVHDETHVIAVESVDALKDMGHGVNMVRKGVSGTTQNQRFAFDMSICNPALTGQILVAAARASMRLKPGCYTMIEIAPIDFLPGDKESLVASLV